MEGLQHLENSGHQRRLLDDAVAVDAAVGADEPRDVKIVCASVLEEFRNSGLERRSDNPCEFLITDVRQRMDVHCRVEPGTDTGFGFDQCAVQIEEQCGLMRVCHLITLRFGLADAQCALV